MKTMLIRSLGCFFLSVSVLIAACSDSTPSQAPEAAVTSAATPSAPQVIWPPLPRHGQDIVLFEEGIDILAPSIYFVLDASGSMSDAACGSKDAKLAIAKKAIQEVFATLGPDIKLGLAVFNGPTIKELVSLGNGPENRQAFMQAIQGVRAGGGTPLKSAIRHAYGKINAFAQRQLGYGAYYRLAIVTDGDPDMSEDPRGIVDQIFNESPVDVMTIGFCIGATHALNQPGKTTYVEASDFESLRKGLRTVLAEAPGYSDVK